ncbi:dimethylmenaquinone methyltransferase [Acidihalobacter yilgarnensis]|uniref:Dimethylmenaquinone methyltransferase n=1 Tax=Acidihalobacter yilgarnensis TaxID=2819280 RepID=A0A1D8ITB8_9GAMM|nr:FAD-linked oxidase C-terminal domain-containing protein [Acidihalobacter yilgarnensis]AOU99770.1 dimethylmenaquinone methyltransferase [Acidihalobacter yilgarnensis]
MPLPPDFLAALANLLPPADLLTEASDCWTYGYDNSKRHAPPEAVAFPREHDQIVSLVCLCNEFHIPITPRGRGTGTTGATVPTHGGLVLSLERMDKILRVDPDNRLLVAQPGATNLAVQQAAAAHGFFWPPDPTSAAVCTIGGNLAYNSAGPRAVKYGTPRENTLGLRAVTGDGRSIRTGVMTTKGVVGYDLTRLIIGSEGTLAIITEAVLKLTPKPAAKRTLQAVYADLDSAARAIAAIMAQPVVPCALEFIDGSAIEMIRSHSRAELPQGAGALLMIEVDGPPTSLEEAVGEIMRAAKVSGCLSVKIATTQAEVEALWATRKALSPALRTIAPKKINEDVVVPVSRIPALIEGLQALGRRHEITIVNFGHAGNGNIHVNLLIDPDDPRQAAAAEHCLQEVFELVLRLEGTLSGEHGVGLVKRDYVALEIDAATLTLMRGIKHQFDPLGLLNADKALPPAAIT